MNSEAIQAYSELVDGLEKETLTKDEVAARLYDLTANMGLSQERFTAIVGVLTLQASLDTVRLIREQVRC